MSRETIAEITYGEDPTILAVSRVLRTHSGNGNFVLIQANPKWIKESIKTGKPIEWGLTQESHAFHPNALGITIAAGINEGSRLARIALTDQKWDPSKKELRASLDTDRAGQFILEIPHPSLLAESIAKRQPISWLEATKIRGLTLQSLGDIISWEIMQKDQLFQTPCVAVR